MSDPAKHSSRQVLNASVVFGFGGEAFPSLALLIVDSERRLITVEMSNKAE